MNTRNTLGAVAGFAIAAAGGAVIAAATVGPESIAFPADYQKWQMYATVDRYDSKQYRELYAQPEVVKAVREGRPIPDGAVIVMAIHAAQVDDKGVPQKDAKGRFIKTKLAGVTVMEKRKGWGASVPEDWRNADWQYSSFRADADDSPHQVTVVEKGLRTPVLLKGQSTTLVFNERGRSATSAGCTPR